jgi:hypothetical protein
MNELLYHTLPDWIQSSALCINQIDNMNSCDDDDDSTSITIICPHEYSNFNLNIQSYDDMIRLLSVIEYWGVNNSLIPYELFDYMFNHHEDCIEQVEEELNRRGKELNILELFKKVIKVYRDRHNWYFQGKNSNNNRLWSDSVYRLMSMLRCDIIKLPKLLLQTSEINEDIVIELVMLASKHGSIDVLTYFYSQQTILPETLNKVIYVVYVVMSVNCVC